MEQLQKMVSDMGKLTMDLMPPEIEPLNLGCVHGLLENIDMQVEPNPIYEPNELLAEQNDLLHKQLEALQKQNEELMHQAEDSAREARASKVFGWISFRIGTAIAIITLFVD